MCCMSKVITALYLENQDIYFKQIIQHIKNIPFLLWGVGFGWSWEPSECGSFNQFLDLII